jgi:cupin 2 domain-containing protein
MIIDSTLVKNIFTSSAALADKPEEVISTLLSLPNITVEQIVSNGNPSPKGFWYEQFKDEWVVLLTGKAELEFENSTIPLKAGDYLMIPAFLKHRVKSVSAEPNCIWLAIHGDFKL